MNPYFLIFLVSMVPLLELRFAVPMAVGMGLPLIKSIIICAIGNMLPTPFIYLFARRVLIWGMDKPIIGRFFRFVHDKGESAGRKLSQKAGRRGLFLALILFVGIPVPGTGAWTGTLAASFLDIGIRTTELAIMIGLAMAGTIMTLASSGFFHLFGL